MPSTPWFPPAPIARASPIKRRCAGSTRPVGPSSTRSSSSLSFLLRRRKCPLSSPLLAPRFPPPSRHFALIRCLPEELSGLSPLFFGLFFPLICSKDRIGFRRALPVQVESLFPEDFA